MTNQSDPEYYTTPTPEEIQFRNQIRQLKSDIKTLSAEQRVLKQQRKTVHLKVERTIEPPRAAYLVQGNTYNLKHMFILYGEVRNKPCGYEDRADVLTLQVLRDKYFPKPTELTAFSDVKEMV